MVAWRWQHGSIGGSGGSTAVVASLAVEVAAWQKRNFSGSSSAFGSAVAEQRQRRQQCGIGGGSMVYADNNGNGHDDGDD